MEISKELIDAVKAASEEVAGKLTLACAAAFRIAEEQKVSLGTIGRICNENDIKIKSCQLGCFK
ncbi:MAG: hypothetical protein GX751_10510 [Desulfuromonadaceae bacterium]|nr:hypothetical protein [Desulfuromonadaceae bacterium]